MVRKSGSKFTYANVASSLALVVAVVGGGAATAATLMPKNSVGSPQIINGSIKGKDIKNDSVNTKKVTDGSLLSSDVKDGALTGADLADGSLASADITDNSLTGGDVLNGSVGSADVTDGSLSGGDVADGSLGGADITDGSIATGDITDGSLTHSDFTSNPIGLVQGYAWIDDAATTLGVATTLTTEWVYNSAGGSVTVNRSATGVYTVNFVGLDFYPGNVQVTSYGTTATFCKVQSWGSSTVNVRCFDAAGAATDSRFSLAVIK